MKVALESITQQPRLNEKSKVPRTQVQISLLILCLLALSPMFSRSSRAKRRLPHQCSRVQAMSSREQWELAYQGTLSATRSLDTTKTIDVSMSAIRLPNPEVILCLPRHDNFPCCSRQRIVRPDAIINNIPGNNVSMGNSPKINHPKQKAVIIPK